jgi:hypothetical protein
MGSPRCSPRIQTVCFRTPTARSRPHLTDIILATCIDMISPPLVRTQRRTSGNTKRRKVCAGESLSDWAGYEVRRFDGSARSTAYQALLTELRAAWASLWRAVQRLAPLHAQRCVDKIVFYGQARGMPGAARQLHRVPPLPGGGRGAERFGAGAVRAARRPPQHEQAPALPANGMSTRALSLSAA